VCAVTGLWVASQVGSTAALMMGSHEGCDIWNVSGDILSKVRVKGD
jgi:hypothetical protein